MEEPDNIYLNVVIDSKNTESKYAELDNRRPSPYINNCSNYLFAIERMYLGIDNIPIFIWPGDDKFKITIEYDNTIVDKYLQFIPNDRIGTAVWNIDDLLKPLNIALEEAYNDIKLLKPSIPATESVKIYFESTTRLFYLIAEIAYDSDLPNPIKIYMNGDLYSKFYGFDSYLISNDQIQILIYDEKLNKSSGKYTMNQSYSSLFKWWDLHSIEIHTQNIPVVADFESTEKAETINKLGDFNIIVPQLTQFQAIQYFPGANLNFKSLNGKSLNRISVFVYWISKNGTRYKIIKSSISQTTFRFVFKKRVSHYLQLLNTNDILI